MTFFLQINIHFVKQDDCVMKQVFVLHEIMLAKWQRRKNWKNKMVKWTAKL